MATDTNSFSSAWKADNKARKAAGKAVRTFAQYKSDHERMASARAARSVSAPVVKRTRKAAAPAVKVAAQPTERTYERVGHRVDCFGVNKSGLVTLAVDLADARKAEQALSKLYCLRGEQYTSKRGERVRMSVQQPQISKVVQALIGKGLHPAGANGWSRVGISL